MGPRALRLIAIAFAFVAISPIWAQQHFIAKCIGVTDGDTITVLADGNKQIKIRLEGIDAPEPGADFSRKSRKFMSSLVFSKDVTIVPKELDRYGRTVARVIVDGQVFSIAMVQTGMAWHYTQHSNDPELAKAERLAKAAKIGIWSLPNPITPTQAQALKAQAPNTGQVQSKVFHGSWCRYYNCKNCTAVFNLREEAIRAGYRPGGHCKP